jgi:tRNA 2-thiouridine synthesizing protein B
MDIFLLTKPPKNPRSELCFKLIQRTQDARQYLAGDGVYCLLNDIKGILPNERIFACKEDMEARGIPRKDGVTAHDDFYEQLVGDMMEEKNGFYSF